jgi:selenide,water dikinase
MVRLPEASVYSAANAGVRNGEIDTARLTTPRRLSSGALSLKPACMSTPEPRLTSLAHGGGCGCKLAPAVLRDILKGMPLAGPFADLMVGTETSDDAAVWRLNDQQALVATTDFFMPVVDDPFDFGRIAATNALSDVYAMGATPIFALALVGMPVNVLSTDTIGRILQGGASVCAAAGIPVAGGHSIDSVEPIYGLVALGLVHPDQVLTNRGARAGDVLILTKALGVGVLSAAFKQERLGPDGYAALIASTTKLNTLGARLAGRAGVHAVTDVTGFGLLGHALEMARGSDLRIEIWEDSPALLEGVAALARAGVRTGASTRNWASYGAAVELRDGFEDWRRDLLTDPQTSGGLLIAVADDDAEAVLDLARAEGFDDVTVIGRVVEGPVGVLVI